MPLIGPEGKEQLRLAARYGAVGLHLVLAILLGYYGGHWIDGRFGTGQTFALIGLGIGVLSGFLELYRIVKKTDLSKL